MSVMTRLMDVPSDDLFAELFAKQLGVLFGTGGTISSGARVIRETIAASYGLHPTILDGSGLSRNDRTSPVEIVDLLRELWHTPVGNELSASLPIVGEQGTVQTDRAQDGRGRQVHRQDRHARRRHEPGRVLPRQGRSHARVRAVHRRAAELDRDHARERHGRRDRSLLSAAGLANRSPINKAAIDAGHLERPQSGPVQATAELNLRELQRYLSRISDRWPLEAAMLGGARVDDARGALPQRERGPEYVLVLVSQAFDGMPWLERVYQATALWDALEMGAAANVHCYTPEEFARKRVTMPAVRDVAQRGMLLYEDQVLS